LLDVFTDEMTQHILRNWEKIGIYSSKSDFLYEIVEWIYKQDGWETSRQIVEEIIVALKI
jgi:hypothetical protein